MLRFQQGTGMCQEKFQSFLDVRWNCTIEENFYDKKAQIKRGSIASINRVEYKLEKQYMRDIKPAISFLLSLSSYHRLYETLKTRTQ